MWTSLLRPQTPTEGKKIHIIIYRLSACREVGDSAPTVDETEGDERSTPVTRNLLPWANGGDSRKEPLTPLIIHYIRFRRWVTVGRSLRDRWRRRGYTSQDSFYSCGEPLSQVIICWVCTVCVPRLEVETVRRRRSDGHRPTHVNRAWDPRRRPPKDPSHASAPFHCFSG